MSAFLPGVTTGQRLVLTTRRYPRAEHHPTCACIPNPNIHQIANYPADKSPVSRVRALDPVSCLAQAAAPGPSPPLHDRCSRNIKPVSGHHHQDDHGILNRQQWLGATTATGENIRVAGQQPHRWEIRVLKLTYRSDGVIVPHLLAVLDSTEHPAEANRGGKDHGSKARRPPRKGRVVNYRSCRILVLTTRSAARERHHPT